MSPRSHFRRCALSLAIGATFTPTLLLAQGTTTPDAATSRNTDSASAAQNVVVTGNPLRSTAIAAPTNVLGGDALVLRRGSTLGETLDGLPGLSSSYFGPNANRPMIRGQDGDRIRVLSNSGVPLDASALSYDHAVPIDPLVIERIEVLSGPAALLYGGGAMGGVVNAIDNRIPKAEIDGVMGAAELRYGGPATERGAGALVESGGKGFAMHADGFWRQTDDMKVPWYQRPTEGVGLVPSDTIINSASKSYGGALGASMVREKGYLGASVDTFHSDYGTVAEEDVSIDMFLNKLTFAGEVRDLGGFISALSGQWLVSDYQHQEIEGSGAVATTFKSKGSDLRLQAEHKKIDLSGGSLAGVFGLQTENADFSALDEEAFVPSTTTRQLALFALEEWALGDTKLSFGGRIGHAKVESEGDAPGQAQFGPAQSRSFTPFSAALGG
jgi:iron complex outermembrane recepter protein